MVLEWLECQFVNFVTSTFQDVTKSISIVKLPCRAGIFLNVKYSLITLAGILCMLSWMKFTCCVVSKRAAL